MTITLTEGERRQELNERTSEVLQHDLENLREERTGLLALKADLAARSVLDLQRDATAELKRAGKRLIEVDSQIEILEAAKANLSERLDSSRRLVLVEKRTKDIEELKAIIGERAEAAAEVDAAVAALTEKIAAVVSANEKALPIVYRLGGDERVRRAFDGRRTAASLERLLGQYLFRFNLEAIPRVPGHDHFDFVDALGTLPDDAYLQNLPLGEL